VIVSGLGHVMTNHHVVSGERGLQVHFVDGSRFGAAMVGTDKDTDLALLRIQPPEEYELTPVEFADSDRARVGDWVLAVGSPFGYSHTVTAGIISAKHRRTRMDLPYQDFIQTDTAINPGNSGGALVNMEGELVGVNSLLVTQGRSYEGIGFAISSNLVKWVYERLAKDGKVRRGYLGVELRDIDEKLAREFRSSDIRSLDDLLDDLGLQEPEGVFIYKVVSRTPAARAGLRRGDVIIEFNGRPVPSVGEVFFAVAEVEPGTEVELTILRDSKLETHTIEMAERKN
jgi:serine protease Do